MGAAGRKERYATIDAFQPVARTGHTEEPVVVGRGGIGQIEQTHFVEQLTTGEYGLVTGIGKSLDAMVYTPQF